MNARDELAELIWDEDACDWRRGPNEAADAILAAGYRKPRQVNTVEELDALPVGSAIHAQWIDVIQPSVMVKEDATWYCATDGDFYDSTDLTLPTAVLYEPRP